LRGRLRAGGDLERGLWRTSCPRSRRYGVVEWWSGGVVEWRSTTGRLHCAGYGSDRALRDGSPVGRGPGSKLPGYDHSVPSGQCLSIPLPRPTFSDRTRCVRGSPFGGVRDFPAMIVPRSVHFVAQCSVATQAHYSITPALPHSSASSSTPAADTLP
jgi:hypothetical protein